MINSKTWLLALFLLPTLFLFPLVLENQSAVALETLDLDAVDLIVGNDVTILPEQFDIALKRTGGNAPQSSADAQGNRATAMTLAKNEEGGNASGVRGVNINWRPNEKLYGGVDVTKAEVTVVANIAYTLQNSGIGRETSSASRVLVRSGGVNHFAAEQTTNGAVDDTKTVTFTTFIDELGSIEFVAQTEAVAGDFGEAIESRADAVINIDSLLIFFKPDYIVADLEITQVVQDLNNSVRLVEGKKTYVRAHVIANRGDAEAKVPAQLVITKGAAMTKVQPVKEIKVLASPKRERLDDAYLFIVPKAFLSGEVSFEVRLNHTDGRARDPEEMLYNNNELKVDRTFVKAPITRLALINVSYRQGANTRTVERSTGNLVQKWFTKIYPSNSVSIWWRTGQMAQADWGCRNMWQLAQQQRTQLIARGNRFAAKTLFVSLFHETSPFKIGCARVTLDGQVSSSPVGSTAGVAKWAWDRDGKYADWYTSHEASHSIGIRHARCSGEGGPDTNFPSHPTGDISKAKSGKDALFGIEYDTSAKRYFIHPPTDHDIMTYCPNQWISKYHYERILDGAPRIRAASVSTQIEGEYWAFIGVLDGASATLEPLYRYDDPIVLPEESSDGLYNIVAYDRDGQEIARHPFAPYEIEESNISPAAASPRTYLGFTTFVPVVEGVTTLTIETPDGVVETIEAPSTSPQLEVPPQPLPATGTFSLTWRATSTETLTALVEYSADGGETWYQLDNAVNEEEIMIDTTELPASEQAQLQVWVSDGFHTVKKTTPLFAIDNHLPVASIDAAETAFTLVSGQTLQLDAYVDDVDTADAGFDDSQVLWSSSIDGDLGSGLTLATNLLSTGTHTVTLTADDGAGGVVTDTVTVSVVDSFDELPVVDDELVANTKSIFLDMASDVLTDTLFIENLVTDPISWTASATGWVSLSTTVGQTSAEIVVGVNATAESLAAGYHEETIILSSPSGDSEFTVPVILFVPGIEPSDNKLLLPFVVTQ